MYRYEWPFCNSDNDLQAAFNPECEPHHHQHKCDPRFPLSVTHVESGVEVAPFRLSIPPRCNPRNECRDVVRVTVIRIGKPLTNIPPLALHCGSVNEGPESNYD